MEELICDYETASTKGGKFCKHSYRNNENPWPPPCNNFNNRSCPYAYICDDCVGHCQEVIEEQKIARAKKKSKTKDNDQTPEKIVQYLDQYVIGQESAKKILAVAVYNHYKRIGKNLDVEIQKSNVMIIGPTGSGKT